MPISKNQILNGGPLQVGRLPLFNSPPAAAAYRASRSGATLARPAEKDQAHAAAVRVVAGVFTFPVAGEPGV